MAKIIKSGRVKSFSPYKHPRGSKGRFVETPDAPKATRGDARRQSRVLKSSKKAVEVHQERLKVHQGLSDEQRKRLALYRGLNPEQRERLLEVLRARKAQSESTVTPEAPPRKPKKSLTQTEIIKQSRVLQSSRKASEVYRARLELYQGLNLDQRRRLQEVLQARKEAKGLQRSHTNTAGKYLAASPDHLSVKGNRLTIWDGKPELAKAQGGFKTKKVKGYEYSVEVDGKQVVLNRNTNMHEYMGDRIYGMPSLTPRLAAMTPVQLADGLAKYMTKVETNDSTVPDWLPTYHGKVDKALVTKGYGKMQQHHIHQWAKVPLDTIVKDYESGKITLDEAKARTQAILSRETIKKKSGKEKVDWVLTPADKDHRAFVVLPGGLHDVTNKPMYLANHPMGIDLDASDYKLRPYRLPKYGDSGRDWHSDTFRPGSWVEIYRRESYVLLGELNRRVAKGEVTHQEAQKLFRDGLDKVDKANQFRIQYSKQQGGQG
ncbi:MAG: hypothetical protein RMZ42_00680 [Nostoc sp. DedQUE05]|uniref:hypothetical protein n=1 Tax=Nostoc sp. DedQUE05 TaxID=3075391 RepID=UPI002AD4967B|nr:hypothetical protein [Nostoc sp. DedQUE05]MDZ8090455.1 hypothetical protein [Nostoc sp. DedQUE05]